MGVGMPQDLLLNQFGSIVWDAFGGPPYLVGSALINKTGWRDVDVRMILADEVWDAMELGDPIHTHLNAKWVAFTLAFSTLGKAMTGLPIDFQLQRQSDCNKEFDAKGRSALGMIPARMANFLE